MASDADPTPFPHPHPTLLRCGVLLCSEAAPERVVHVGPDGICPVHHNGACPLWYVPWPDTRRRQELADPSPNPAGGAA